MNIKIVADSSCDLNDKLENELNIETVPLTIEIDGVRYKDDKNLDVKKMLDDMEKSPNTPKTSCPSPKDFMDSYGGDEDSVFAVTLSSALSGTYNSAVLAKDIFKEKIGNKFVHVFDSLSASIGETLVSLKISQMAKESYDNSEIVEKVTNYINEMKTFFVLESLENLIKAGRIGTIKGKIASVLSIKPIMEGNKDGEISKVETVRGTKKALRRLVDIIGEQGEKLEEKILGIAHCDCPQRAEKLRTQIEKKYNFKDIIVVETAGLSSVYANRGGIIISF